MKDHSSSTTDLEAYIPSASKKETEKPYRRKNRLFVGNLPGAEPCTEEQLQNEFGKYGSIDKIVIIQNKFAFLTFQQDQSAQDALEDHSKSSRYNVQPAKERPVSKVKISCKEKERKQVAVTVFLSLLDAFETEGDIVVVQCNTSHLSRLQAYIAEQDTRGKLHFCVIGATPYGRRNVLSLVLLQPFAGSSAQLAEHASLLAHDINLKPALNQVILVSSRILWRDHALLFDSTWLKKAFENVLKSYSIAHGGERTNADGNHMTFRIQAFPPCLQRPLTEALQDYFDSCQLELSLSPTNFTHVLSFVQLSDDGACLMGLSCATSFFGHLNDRRTTATTNDAISRAYYKLQETFERYDYTKPLLRSLRDKIAMDCGASPGGWTRFLMENGCRQVYSIDPSEMSPSVLAMEGVVYLKMKLSDALHHLELENRGTKEKIDIFVSDMCLHDMEKQLDMLLQAKPLLRPNALFVLTLKCVTGYTKKSYEYQADNVVERLNDEIAFGVKMIHLFANRSAERTIVGYLR